jgi:uncharacterized membrane protein
MAEVKRFLSEKDEEEIVDAIREAEQKTSGEIRVHIERHTDKDVFVQNGVLIYLAIDDRNFVILGDKGINDVVPEDFWETTKDLMVSHFKKGNFKQGLIDGILLAGKQLQNHFPWDPDSDVNELPDKISR